MTGDPCPVKACGTVAISGSRPYANHTDRFYRESAASRGSPCNTLVDHAPHFGQLPYTRKEDICRRCPHCRQAWPCPLIACQNVSMKIATQKAPATMLRRRVTQSVTPPSPITCLPALARKNEAMPRQPNASNLSCFICPRDTQENGKADQRRTTGSASSLDSIRRLIQRLVQRASCTERRSTGLVL